MEREPSPRVQKKDRTDVVVSVVLHVLVIGIALYFVSKTEIGQEILRGIGAVREKPKRTEKPPPAKAISKGALKPPPGAPPPPSSARRAADAPAAVGEGFAVEERKGPRDRSERGSGRTNVQVRVVAPPPAKPLARLFGSAAPKSDIKQLLAERAKAAASTESFGAEQIAKSGVSDAGAIIKNISGASVSEGKFAVIRGLSDRYISTELNGAGIPSADPYRQSVPLDLFPAQVIDKVVVTKTFTPDQAGTTTGGGIDVVTKSFPDKDFLSLSLGGEYNTKATFNDQYLTYDGGGRDWAGMDDGTRALPANVSALAPIGEPIPDAPPSSGVIGTDLYHEKLGEAAFLNEVTRALGTTQFAPRREVHPLNQSFALAGGGSTRMFGHPFGYFASVSYKQNYSFYEDGVVSRYETGTELKSTYTDVRAITVVNWSGMVNLAYNLYEDHELGFTFFYNQNGTDDVRAQLNGTDRYDPGSTFRKFYLYWTERNLNTYQMKGQHRLPDVADLQFNWLVALTQTSQDEPNARFFNDVDTGDGYNTTRNTIPSPNKPTRYFRDLDENSQNVKLDWALPFRNWTDEEGQLKFGLFSSTAERTFTERQFYYPNPRSDYQDDPNLFLTEEQLGLVSIQTNYVRGRPRSLTFNWGDYTQAFDSLYDGEREVPAGYLMVDVPVVDTVRLVGGLRYETTDISVHSESYLDSSVTGLRTNDASLSQSDPLPSVGLIYAVRTNMNVRLNYSQTIARPSFRELAAYYSYDPIIDDFIEGNPLLEMSSIQNYDVRWEWFPRPGELFSISLFYKDVKNAIERGDLKVNSDVITFFNDDATLYGVEFEARKSLDFLGPLFSPFSVGGNLSLVKSEVELRPEDLRAKQGFFPDASSTRPLYDQSPYILNLDFNYSNPRWGTSATLVFNVAGPRIAITKLNTEDVYEQPTPTLDLVLSQKIGRQMTVKFAAKNLLDPEIERTYGEDSDLLYSSYKRGLTFGLSLSYDF